MDAALRSHATTSRELLDTAVLQRNPRGRRRLEWAVTRGDAKAESPGESISRAVIEWYGFPAPQLQVEHRIRGRTYRTDFCWPDHRVIGESDGWMKYDDRDPSAAASAVRDEKRREDALRRDGWRVARWDYSGALRVEGLRTALHAAGLPVTRRRNESNLLAVGHNSRST